MVKENIKIDIVMKAYFRKQGNNERKEEGKKIKSLCILFIKTFIMIQINIEISISRIFYASSDLI